jgi:hypothetical protein
MANSQYLLGVATALAISMYGNIVVIRCPHTWLNHTSATITTINYSNAVHIVQTLFNSESSDIKEQLLDDNNTTVDRAIYLLVVVFIAINLGPAKGAIDLQLLGLHFQQLFDWNVAIVHNT